MPDENSKIPERMKSKENGKYVVKYKITLIS